MYAIIEVCSKQYKVCENDELFIEKPFTQRTHKLTLDRVLLAAKDKKVKLGNPYLKDVKVNCEIIGPLKAKKRIAFKYRKRKSSHFKRGQRQKLLKLKVKEIVFK